MPRNLRFRSLVCLAGMLAACATAAPRTADELDRFYTDHAKTTLRRDRFELTSPFDDEGTSVFAEIVGEEMERVLCLLGDPGGDPVRIHLVPVDPQGADAHATEMDALFPGRDGISGGTIDGRFICVYVTRPGAGPGELVAGAMRRGTLRHELVHLVAGRWGLGGATWFDEGLARYVEKMSADGGHLRDGPLSTALLVARATAHRGTVADLLAWTSRDDLTPEARGRRYDQAEALFRYLVAREPDGGFMDRVRRVRTLPDDALAASESAWLEWLGSRDALSAIREGVRRADERERREAAALLPTLASVAPELRSRAADDLALELLRDPVARDAATTFLVFFRASAVTPQDLAALRAADDLCLVLVGEALRARRGEPFDAARAQAIWDGLSALERMALLSAAHALSLERR